MATLSAVLEQVGPSASRAAVRTHTVWVDRPLEAGGTDAGPKGGEYLLVAAGGCFMTHLLAAIRAREAALSGVRVAITGTMDGSPERFTDLTLTVTATGDDAVLRRMVVVAERACQVLNTLKRAVSVAVVVGGPTPADTRAD